MRVGASGCEDLIDEEDKGGLLFEGSVGDGEFFPVVWVDMDITPAVGTQEVVGGAGVHHGKEVFHGEAAARLFEIFAPREVRAGRFLVAVTGYLFKGIVPDTGKAVPGNECPNCMIMVELLIIISYLQFTGASSSRYYFIF